MNSDFDALDTATSGTDVSVHAGFPNAAADRRGRALDFNQLLIQHPSSTFCFRISGPGHEARGIFDGDIAVIDRALQPRIGDLVIAFIRDEFVMHDYRRGDTPAEVWGVITATIHQRRP